MHFLTKNRVWHVAGAALILMASMMMPAGAQSQPDRKEAKGPLAISLSLKRVVTDAQGKETLLDAAKVKPGDVLEYQAVYANVSKQPLQNVLATLPVPSGMEYQGQSARPMPVLASTNSGNFAAEPLMRKVKDKDGREKLEPVPFAEYRNLRWVVKSVEPGKQFVVSARMRVAQNAPTGGAQAAVGGKEAGK